MTERNFEMEAVLRDETTEDLYWALEHGKEEGFTPEYILGVKEELRRRGEDSAIVNADLDPLAEEEL